MIQIVASITQWIRNFVSLVLCITFFEMLLPRSSIAKYARFVFGLLVIVSLLDPLLSLRNYLGSGLMMQDLEGKLQLTSSIRMEQNIIEQGEKLVVNSLSKRLADHIRDVLVVTEGIKDASVYVLVEKSGDIKKVDVAISLSRGEHTGMENKSNEEGRIRITLPGIKHIQVSAIGSGEPIKGDLERNNIERDETERITEKVKGIVADICGISRERISVSVI